MTNIASALSTGWNSVCEGIDDVAGAEDSRSENLRRGFRCQAGGGHVDSCLTYSLFGTTFQGVDLEMDITFLLIHIMLKSYKPEATYERQGEYETTAQRRIQALRLKRSYNLRGHLQEHL